MVPRESTPRRLLGTLLVTALLLVWSADGVAAPDCAWLAARTIEDFSRVPMESLEADDTIENPCTGNRELASIDFRPGYGFMAMFLSGDIHGEADPYVVTLCDDGRATLTDAVKSTLICDTR